MRKTVLGLAFVFVSALLSAGNFTPGNIVVVRVGTGSAVLSNASTAVFLDEYTTSGTLVQSIALPTLVSGPNHALTLSGTATSEGSLNLSSNGQYLSLAGYDTSTGYAGVSSGVSNRTIARVGADGVVNTSTGYLAGSAYVKNNIRSAVSNDGNEFWTAGTGTGVSGGVWYVPFGSFTATAIQTGTTNTNSRVVSITNGQLYFSTASGTTGIYTDSAGLPTTTGQTEAILPGIRTADSVVSPYAFLILEPDPLVPAQQVLYVADDDEAPPYGGVYKYSLVGGTWVSNGNIPSVNGLRGITGFHICSGSQLYLTAGNGIYTFFDSAGYNQPITGAYTKIATADTNTVIRGIAFAPGYVAPTPPIASISSLFNVSCYGLGNGSINISVAGGVSPLSYAWTGGATSPGLTGLAPGIYTVTVTDYFGCTSTVGDTVIQPDSLSLSLTAVNDSVHGASDGSIGLTVSGGTGSYTYLWSNTETTSNISNLPAGAYCVTVTDQDACRDSNCISVGQPTGINGLSWINSFSVATSETYIKVDLTAAEQMNISAQMYDMAGQLIRQGPGTIQSQLHWLIPTAEIPSGCYIIRISSDQGAAVKKALVIK